MDSGTSGAKWLVGTLIALLAAGGGIVALLNYFKPPGANSGPVSPSNSRSATNESGANVTPTARNCTIQGAVYNDDNDPPTAIPNVKINYIPSRQTAGVFLTKTAPNGQFRGNCSHIGSEQFPLTLELSSDHWRGITSKTPEQVLESGKDNINIYVSLKEINNGIIKSRIDRIRMLPRSTFPINAPLR